MNMNAATAWNLRGIGHETRLAAEHAARLSGMSLGEWLEDIIAQQAAADGEFDRDSQAAEDKASAALAANAKRVASESKIGGGRILQALRPFRRANDNEQATSAALLDRIDALERRLTSHFAAEAPGGGGAPLASRGDRFRAPRPAPQPAPGLAYALRRPPGGEAHQNSSVAGPQSEQTDMEKINSTLHAMHRLLEAMSRKLARVEEDSGYARRLLEASDPDFESAGHGAAQAPATMMRRR
jgi:hypothetical protein